MSTPFFLLSCAAILGVMLFTLKKTASWFGSERTSYPAALLAVLLIAIAIYFISRSAYALNNRWIYASLLFIIPYIIKITLKTDLYHGSWVALATCLSAIAMLSICSAIWVLRSQNDLSLGDVFSSFKTQMETGLQPLKSQNLAFQIAKTLSDQEIMHTPRMNTIAGHIKAYCACPKQDEFCHLTQKNQIELDFTNLTAPALTELEQDDLSLLKTQALACHLDLPAITAKTAAPTDMQNDRSEPAHPSTPASDNPIHYQNIPISEAATYIGYTVRLTLNNSVQRQGQLMAVTENNLELEIQYPSGLMRSQIPLDSIQKIEIQEQAQINSLNDYSEGLLVQKWTNSLG